MHFNEQQLILNDNLELSEIGFTRPKDFLKCGIILDDL